MNPQAPSGARPSSVPDRSRRFIARLAAVIALAAIACLFAACSSDAPPSRVSATSSAVSTTRLEAENAATNLPTETLWHGYSGSSYLCCWSAPGQYVTFTVNVATAGSYTLALGYSAGNGDATRQLQVNGVVVTTSQTFAATADWNTWSTAQVTAQLNAGSNTVTTSFINGSSNYINLDYLDVTATSGGGGPGPRYEAENSATNLPTETRWPGYSGASYLCCWASDGQYATFNVSVSAAGSYMLAFGYSAGNGNATRSLQVNGSVVGANETFAGTPSWSSWATTAFGVQLSAGANAITLSFVSGSGSSNYINLDYLDVVAGGGGPPPPPPSGEYDDTDGSIVYSLGPSGSIWNQGGGPEDFDGDEHYTNVYASSFTVNFSGTDFTWVGKKGPNFGIASVYLDGQLVTTVDNYNATTLSQQALYSWTQLSNGPHVFKAAIGGYPNPAKNPASSDTYQVMDGFITSGTPLRNLPTVSAENAAKSSGWTCGNDTSDLSGSHCWSNVTGSTISVSFSGTGIEVYARPDGENGIASVYLDGQYQGDYDGFGLPYDTSCDDCVNGQNAITMVGLAPGSHTFELVVTSQKNSQATDYYTQIDEFMVLP